MAGAMAENLARPEIMLIGAAAALALGYGLFLLNHPPSLIRSVAKTVPVLLLALAGLIAGLPVMVVLALIACAAGDWLLSLEGESHFLGGLGAFLAGHLLYIGHFASLAEPERFFASDMGFLAFILAALVLSVLTRLWPYLGGLRLPVIVYAVVIASMAFAARAADPGQLVLAGIAAFMVSDIILAQDKFTPLSNSPLRKAMPWLVWLLYFSGQAMIVLGLMAGIPPVG